MRSIYVSPDGSDKNCGSVDSPLASVQAAVDLARNQAESAWRGETTIYLRGGSYPVGGPIELTGDAPFTITSYPGERAVIDGGERVAGISEGVDPSGRRVWTAKLAPGSQVRSLYWGRERLTRAHLPRNDFFWMESVPGIPPGSELFKGSHQFVATPGDVPEGGGLGASAEAHVYHYWIDEHLPIASYDPGTRLVTATHKSRLALQDDSAPRHAKYRLENLPAGLIEPGDFCVDFSAGVLTYLPREGEKVESSELSFPRTTQLLSIRDCSNLTISGVTFRCTDWELPEVKYDNSGVPDGPESIPVASAPQAASNLPGVLDIARSRRILLDDLTVENTGYYGVNISGGCRLITLTGCALNDLGAGGVKINGADASGPLEGRTRDILIEDNVISAGGRTFLSGVGVISMNASRVTISHNDIHDLYYSGVSCGWVWGYADSVSRDNIIESNHIYDLGHGVLSDMGGIYTLSVQPGTVIRNNLIHDIYKSNYGGWAIYPDEGSSHILIENNVCYNTSSSVFHQHYGHENIVRNNIWAFGGEGMVAFSRSDDKVGFTFERNIVLTDGQPVLVGGYANKLRDGKVRSDMNLYWDVGGNPPRHADAFGDPATSMSLEEARELDLDIFTVVADPKFADPRGGDFTLPSDSPAYEMGFMPIDLGDVGPRKKETGE